MPQKILNLMRAYTFATRGLMEGELAAQQATTANEKALREEELAQLKVALTVAKFRANHHIKEQEHKRLLQKDKQEKDAYELAKQKYEKEEPRAEEKHAWDAEKHAREMWELGSHEKFETTDGDTAYRQEWMAPDDDGDYNIHTGFYKVHEFDLHTLDPAMLTITEAHLEGQPELIGQGLQVGDEVQASQVVKVNPFGGAELVRLSILGRDAPGGQMQTVDSGGEAPTALLEVQKYQASERTNVNGTETETDERIAEDRAATAALLSGGSIYPSLRRHKDPGATIGPPKSLSVDIRAALRPSEFLARLGPYKVDEDVVNQVYSIANANFGWLPAGNYKYTHVPVTTSSGEGTLKADVEEHVVGSLTQGPRTKGERAKVTEMQARANTYAVAMFEAETLMSSTPFAATKALRVRGYKGLVTGVLRDALKGTNVLTLWLYDEKGYALTGEVETEIDKHLRKFTKSLLGVTNVDIELLREYVMAEMRWTNAFVRLRTGAAVVRGEYEREAAAYFQRRGESDGLAQQKRVARRIQLAAIIKASGLAWKVPDLTGHVEGMKDVDKTAQADLFASKERLSRVATWAKEQMATSGNVDEVIMKLMTSPEAAGWLNDAERNALIGSLLQEAWADKPLTDLSGLISGDQSGWSAATRKSAAWWGGADKLGSEGRITGEAITRHNMEAFVRRYKGLGDIKGDVQ